MFFVWLSVQIYSIFYLGLCIRYLCISGYFAGPWRWTFKYIFIIWNLEFSTYSTYVYNTMIIYTVRTTCLHVHFWKTRLRLLLSGMLSRGMNLCMHNWLYASCIIGFMHHWRYLCITECIYASLNNLHASLNRLMHHWIYLCIIELTYASLNILCIIQLTYASLNRVHWIYTDVSLNILMHHWIYRCIIEYIYASLNEFMHQLDINWIYASWKEFMHRGMNLCINFDLLTGALSFFVNIVGTCFVIAPGHRWLVDVSSHGVTIADDLWTCYVLSMTCECVVTMGSGWLTNVSWWVSLTY